MTDNLATAPADTKAKKVWTTLITNTAYLTGLLTLDHSLKKHGSKYPLVALYTDTFPAEGHKALDDRGIPKQHVKYLLPKQVDAVLTGGVRQGGPARQRHGRVEEHG
ncbi:glycosyltransferase family 8 protein [Stemphylium lycopersici]|uniref:Glycosyltransferase family 8 protein n=1 Tax=Stemphylium lycopersici TaxID=183478 RepID=A0A364NDD2_STELY|nr:glycosyltransferase family 8 protein [Stemphylium lycopersici]RAR00118.1 glycosyltransferase family 8 protein [Stemphylium lycopersici]RAR15328.1 glycosyltransferase family 8 protein [Stemphylium lycopersici]